MTVRFRRSLKIAPGVRINFNTHSTSLSLGPRGAHYTMSSSGRRTVSAGIPGTGLYAYQSYNPNKTTRASQTPRSRSTTNQYTPQDLHEFQAPPAKPGLFSGKAEKAFYAFLTDIYTPDNKMTPQDIVEKSKALRDTYDSLMYPLNLIAFVHILNEEQYTDKLLAMGEHLWTNRAAAFADPIVVKYFRGIRPVVRITEGISATDIYNEQQLGFIWSEVLQAHNKLDEAMEVLHQMQATQLVAIAMADLELAQKDYAGALETTDEITNEDDATSILLTLRAIAFREQGHYDASLECLKLALAKRSRDPKALNRAHFERSFTYEKMGKIANAKKDLEMILVDEPSNEEVLNRLKKLSK